MTGMQCIANAIIADSRARLREQLAEDRARPIGEKRLDIGFYSNAESDKPVSDGSMEMRGVHYRWTGARWAVWRVRWTGERWQQYRRLSGPLESSSAALDRLTEECKRLNLERVQ